MIGDNKSEFIFTATEDVGEDSIEATCYGGVVNIEVVNPWAGDTESGFGATCSVGLDRATARLFGEWLMKVTEEK